MSYVNPDAKSASGPPVLWGMGHTRLSESVRATRPRSHEVGQPRYKELSITKFSTGGRRALFRFAKPRSQIAATQTHSRHPAPPVGHSVFGLRRRSDSGILLTHSKSALGGQSCGAPGHTAVPGTWRQNCTDFINLAEQRFPSISSAPRSIQLVVSERSRKHGAANTLYNIIIR